MKKKSAYLITKPLQYINATNIPDDLDKDCFLVDYFSDSNIFFKNIQKYSTNWCQILHFKNKYSALFYILNRKKSYEKIFLDSDFGLLYRIILLLYWNVKIYVYEEGFGTYRKKIRESKTLKDKVLLKIDTLLGQNYIGGYRRTKGIFLYHPEAFSKLVAPSSKKELLNFKTKFHEHLETLHEVSILFPEDLRKRTKGKDVLLFLTSWKIESGYRDILKKYNNHLKILKPHPHIKNNIGIEEDFDITVRNSLPAEILIAELGAYSRSLIVIHQNSSALMYITNIETIKEINISDEKLSTYNEIIKTIRKN
jgi:hypothetical protein